MHIAGGEAVKDILFGTELLNLADWRPAHGAEDMQKICFHTLFQKVARWLGGMRCEDLRIAVRAW